MNKQILKVQTICLKLMSIIQIHTYQTQIWYGEFNQQTFKAKIPPPQK